MRSPSSFPYAFEPLGDHDRTAFSCGVPELDNYLLHQAGQDAKRKVAAPFVMVDSASQVIGYYTLSAYGIRPAACLRNWRKDCQSIHCFQRRFSDVWRSTRPIKPTSWDKFY